MFRLCCICIISIVLFWCMKERYTTPFHTKKRLSTQTLHKKYIVPRNHSIITYNVQRMPYHLKSFYKLQRITRKHSIILLQECYSNVLYDEIQHYFPDFYIAKGIMNGYRLVNSGLVILSRYPILSYTFVAFDDQEILSSDFLSEKGFLVVEISFHNRKIMIINTHLQSSSIENKFDTAIKQTNQLLSYARKITIPFIIGGDFNFPYKEFPATNLNVYRSAKPSIYIKYDKDGKEIDTSSSYKTYYKPFIYDFFITHHIILSFTRVIASDYSDHAPVTSTISHVL